MKNFSRFVLVSFLIFIVCIVSFVVLASDQLKIHYIDVGQADSILLQLPNGQNMLIDAGNNADGDKIVNYIRQQGEVNEWSAVVKVVYKDTSFLFMGDAEHKFEILASSARQPDADVIRIGHHGSDSSTSEAFIKAVSPSYAVIYPLKLVIRRLEDLGIIVLRTDELGER